MKIFAWSYMERVEPKKPRVRRPDVLAIRVAGEWDKQALLAVDPAKFFTVDHYNGFPAVLVRLPEVDEEELRELLHSAWRIQAPKSLLAGAGPAEPPASRRQDTQQWAAQNDIVAARGTE